MSFLRRLTVLALLMVVFAPSGSLVAQPQGPTSSYIVECPKNAPNLSLLRTALRAEVLASIDAAQYAETSVGIGLRKVSLNTPSQTVSAEAILGDIAFQGAIPTGLGFSAVGMTDFAIECEWTYKVRISTRGRAASSGQIVRAVTDSDITIRRKVYARWQRPTQPNP